MIRAEFQETINNYSSFFEEYHIKSSVGDTKSVSGSGKGEFGKGKGGLVDIKGNLNGTILQMLEEWKKKIIKPRINYQVVR